MRTDGQTDRHDDANGRFSQFCAILRTRLKTGVLKEPYISPRTEALFEADSCNLES
jgi:hypothetical protein